MEIFFKMYCVVVLLIVLQNVSFNNSHSIKDAKNLHCYYSRYMLYYFKLTGRFFKNTFGANPEYKDKSTDGDNAHDNDINMYDEQLRSQQNIVLFMLKNLKDITPNFHPPDDLMQINLYLNRIQGNTKIEAREKYFSNNVSYIRGYRWFYTQIVDSLSNFIITCGCGDTEKCMFQDNNTKNAKCEEINGLLAVRYRLRKKKNTNLKEILNKKKDLLEYIFLSTFQEGSYIYLHPDNLLFKVLMHSKKATESSKDNSIDLLTGDDKYFSDKTLIIRDVLTIYKLPNGANATIYDLFKLIKSIFHQKYVMSFQQHVLAAVLYPVFLCLSTYLKVITLLYYPGDNKIRNMERKVELYKKELYSDSTILLGHIEYLIKYQIFPKSVQEYLKNVIAEIGNVISIPRKESLHFIPDRTIINKLFDMCSKPIELNYIQYQTDLIRFDLSEEGKLEHLVDAFKTQIIDVALYVKSLEKYINTFKVVLETYNHENMFKDSPLDLLNEDEMGHKVILKKYDSPTHQ